MASLGKLFLTNSLFIGRLGDRRRASGVASEALWRGGRYIVGNYDERLHGPTTSYHARAPALWKDGDGKNPLVVHLGSFLQTTYVLLFSNTLNLHRRRILTIRDRGVNGMGSIHHRRPISFNSSEISLTVV